MSDTERTQMGRWRLSPLYDGGACQSLSPRLALQGVSNELGSSAKADTATVAWDDGETFRIKLVHLTLDRVAPEAPLGAPAPAWGRRGRSGAPHERPIDLYRILEPFPRLRFGQVIPRLPALSELVGVLPEPELDLVLGAW